MKTVRLQAAVVNTTSEIGHHGCTLVCRRIRELSSQAGIEISSWLPLKLDATDIDWRRFDLVIVNGEGSLHHDRPGAWEIAKLGSHLEKVGTPAYLINTVYQENDPKIADGVGRYRKVWVRESRSASELAGAGIASTVVPDLSLTWGGDGLAMAGQQLVVLDAVDRDDTERLFHFAKDLQVPFFSIMTRPPRISTFADKNIKRILKYQLRRSLGHLSFASAKRARSLNQFPDFPSFVTYIAANAGMLVTGRFHAMCMAFVLEIPVVAVRSNTHKIEGMLADIGIENRLIADTNSISDRLRAGDYSSYRYSDRDIAMLRSYKRAAIDDARRLFADIATDCAS